MPIFTYRAAQASGKVIQGEKAAETRDDIVAFLHDQGLMVVSIEEKVAFNLKTLGELQIGDISLKEKVFFVKQLAAMLQAGLPIVQSLEILLDQTKYQGVKAKLTAAYKDIKSGLPMAGAFRKQELLFNELQLSLIEAGEQSGNLVEVMKQIADDMQKSHQLRSKVRGALIYPAVILVTSVIVVIVLVVFMIPAVETLYLDLGATAEDIPAITRFLVSLSKYFTSPFGVIATIVAVIALILGFRGFYHTDYGRKFVDRLLLKIPVFGDLITKMQVLETTRLLSMLLKSGISIIDALTATSKSLGNIHFKLTLEYAADKVSKGSPISLPMAKTGVMPIMVVKMIATGEETGSLDKILEDVARFYQDEVDELTSNLTKLMEPLMLLIVGGLVAFLALAVYLPIYSIAKFV